MKAWFRLLFVVPAALAGGLTLAIPAWAADVGGQPLDLRVPASPALDAQGRTEMRAADEARDSAAMRNLRAMSTRRPYGTGYEARRGAFDEEVNQPTAPGGFSFNASNPPSGGAATLGAARGSVVKSSGAAGGAASGAGQGGRGRR